MPTINSTIAITGMIIKTAPQVVLQLTAPKLRNLEHFSLGTYLLLLNGSTDSPRSVIIEYQKMAMHPVLRSIPPLSMSL